MTDKIVTIREKIPVHEPVSQSYVADWSTYSQAGGDKNSEGTSDQDGTESEFGGSQIEGDDGNSVTGSAVNDGASIAESGNEADEHEANEQMTDEQMTDEQETDEQAGGGLLQRVWPFARKAPNSEKGAPATVPIAAPIPDFQAPPERNAAEELVKALSSVTRSSSGESIADILLRISMTLKSIETMKRTSQGSSASLPPLPGPMTGPVLQAPPQAARKADATDDEDE
jgi:hypothetical protein